MNKAVWVAIHVTDEGGSILARKRTRGIDTNMYGPPGGHCERGETLVQAAVRELKEETGFQTYTDFCKLCAIIEEPRGIVFYYTVKPDERLGSLQQEEGHGLWCWMSVNTLRDEHQAGKLQQGMAVFLRLPCADQSCYLLLLLSPCAGIEETTAKELVAGQWFWSMKWPDGTLAAPSQVETPWDDGRIELVCLDDEVYVFYPKSENEPYQLLTLEEIESGATERAPAPGQPEETIQDLRYGLELLDIVESVLHVCEGLSERCEGD